MLTIIQIDRTEQNRFALFPTESEMTDPAFFSQICHIMLGNHPASQKLLYPVEPGTALAKSGVTNFIYIAFFTLPFDTTAWIKSIAEHLPPNLLIVGGSFLLTNVKLAEPQEGSFTAAILGVAPITK